MSKRPTPETDSQIKTFTSVSKLKKSFENRTGTVSAGFARKLERERDEAREALRTLAEHGENEIQKLIKECDEARDQADKYLAILKKHNLDQHGN